MTTGATGGGVLGGGNGSSGGGYEGGGNGFKLGLTPLETEDVGPAALLEQWRC